MTDAQFRKAVGKFHGWIEADKAHFPTPELLTRFLAYREAFESNIVGPGY